MMSLVAFVLLSALYVAGEWASEIMRGRGPIESIAVKALELGILQNLLKTPLAIAVHRFIILGEVSHRYTLWPLNLRFLQFFGFLVLLSLLGYVYPLGHELARQIGVMPETMATIVVVGILFSIVVAWFSIRAIVLFPAVAVDDARWEWAIEATTGVFWKTVAILTLTLIPIGIAKELQLSYVQKIGLDSSVGSIANSAISAIFSFMTIVALVAIASRLYLALAKSSGPDTVATEG
ncbi:MAG TPA: hypothetical protein VGG27_14245 [Magnetospirillaceae bacterium]